jgi:23S rRNA (adenine2030-N6)-methyltransferase
MKDDYTRAARAVTEIYRRMPAAQILLWYPVVQRAHTDRLLATLLRTNVKDVWQYELGVERDNDERGMTACGMLVVNPPWTLATQMRSALPLLQQHLAPEAGHAWVRNLVGE